MERAGLRRRAGITRNWYWRSAPERWKAFLKRQRAGHTCPKCGHVARANRRSSSDFTCVRCGFSGKIEVVESDGLININIRES